MFQKGKEQLGEVEEVIEGKAKGVKEMIKDKCIRRTYSNSTEKVDTFYVHIFLLGFKCLRIQSPR